MSWDQTNTHDKQLLTNPAASPPKGSPKTRRPMATHFAHVPVAPDDPILGLNARFLQDSDPRKINLGVGAYRTEEGKPLVFNVVRKV